MNQKGNKTTALKHNSVTTDDKSNEKESINLIQIQFGLF